jgi:hypothetical protein
LAFSLFEQFDKIDLSTHRLWLTEAIRLRKKCLMVKEAELT